jgi:O-acetyl-ADP-ribose deacetylase (regulator of RNase III)
MIEYIEGDVLNSGEQIVVHGCNCFNTMGSGIAKQVSIEYPEACLADYDTLPGDVDKLGNYTTAVGKNGTRIINAYTQYHYSRVQVNADYNAIEKALRHVCEDFPEHKVIAMPKIGAGLAGGDWNIIEKILETVSNEYDRVFRVYLFHNIYPVKPVRPDFSTWPLEKLG